MAEKKGRVGGTTGDTAYRVPRSTIAETVWPAIPAPGPAMLLALQFQLDRSQWWPLAVLEDHQRQQLGRLLDHAAATVPFYGARLQAAGYRPGMTVAAEFWKGIPVLRRAEVQAAGETIFTSAIPASHGASHRIATSGTTGTPVTVVKSQLEQLIWQAITLREELWQGRRWEGTVAVIRAFPDRRFAYPEGARIEDWGAPLADVFPTGPSVALSIDTGVAEQADWLIRRDPHYLLTDAANLAALAAYFRAQNLALPNLREVRTVGDVVDAGLRRACEVAWGARVVDIYSSTEAGYLALQCPEHDQLHVQMEAVVVEILDADGEACAVGEVGEVVVTPLHNFATPFLRYALDDRASWGEACACGRGLPVVNGVHGRAP